MIKRIKNSGSLRQKVYEIVKDYITSAEVSPGSKIDEEGLSRKMGVSKTPIREALSKLALDGIVEIKPNRGAFKVALTQDDVLEIMRIREALESLCVRLAVIHLTAKGAEKLRTLLGEMETRFLADDLKGFLATHYEFHSVIHQVARSPRLLRIIRGMYALINLVREQYFIDPDHVRQSLALHKKLLSALEARDADLAEKIRREMLTSTYRSLLESAESRESFHPRGRGLSARTV